jgi:pimeloyl-[acyl-carrier protein] synthase
VRKNVSEVAIDVDFSKVQSLGNRLLDQLNELREHSPIFWSKNQKAWIVTGHAEVTEGFHGKLPLTANRLPRLLTFMPEPEASRRIPYTIGILPRFLISLDPPEQQRVRKLMMRAFSRKIAESYRPFVREVIHSTLDEAAARGELEFVENVARRIPARVILKLMGLDEGLLPRLRHWAWAQTSGLSGGGTTPEILDECEKAFLEMKEIFDVEIARRKADPREDFISALVHAEEDGQRLSHEDILATCYLTLIAGHDTTANSLGLGTAALAGNRSAWDLIRSMQPEQMDGAVMEISRYIAMSTTMSRVVNEDFEWKGNLLRRGQIVYLMIAGANRDPAVFDHPEALDLARPQGPNMTFAPGLHFCIGHFLAKMQLGEFFQALVARFAAVELLDEGLHWGTSVGFRGLQNLNVRLIERPH